MASGEKITNELIATRVATTSVASNSSTFTNTEVSLATVTAYLIDNKRYKVAYPARFSVATAAQLVTVRLREDTVSGTQLQAAQVYCHSTDSVGFDVYIEVEYTATTTGNKTFVLTAQRNGGSGNVTMLAAASSTRCLTVTLIPT